jgi:hypothetical protein
MKLLFYFQNKEVDIDKTLTVYFVWIVIISFTLRVYYISNHKPNYPVVNESSSISDSNTDYENGNTQAIDEEVSSVDEEAPAAEAATADTADTYIGSHVYSDKSFKVINQNAIA